MLNEVDFVNSMVITIDCTHADGKIQITIINGEVVKIAHLYPPYKGVVPKEVSSNPVED